MVGPVTSALKKGKKAMTSNELGTLLEICGKSLSCLCYRLCKNEHDAKDLFQETCVKLLKSRFSFQNEAAAKTYMYKTCLNAYRDLYKAQKKTRLCDAEKSRYIESIAAPEEEKEDYARLYDAIGALPFRYKTVIVLCYFKELSEKDIAGILHVPPGTVKSRLYKAKQLLRKELEKE